MLAILCLVSASKTFAAEPFQNVRVTIEKWRKPGSNNIGTADITVTNDNAFAVKDIRVKCSYVAKAGGRNIETEQTLPVTVKAKTSSKFRKLKFGFIDVQAAEGSCEVRSVTQI